MEIKKVLVLYKQSSYKHFFLNRSDGHPFHQEPIAKRFIKTHNVHYQTLAKVEAFFKSYDIPYEKKLRGRKIDFSIYDLIVTVGGDGTFLEGAGQVKAQLMLGINSDPQWSVGRFCTAHDNNFSEIILKVLNGSYEGRSLNRMKIYFKQGKCLEYNV